MIKEEILDIDESMDKSSEWSECLPSSSTTASVKADNNELQLPDADNSVLGYRSMTITDGRFFKRVPEKCIYNSTVASCVKCEPGYIEIKGTVNSSSNFLCHLKRKHGKEAVEEYTEYLRSKKRPSRPVSDITTRQGRASALTSMTSQDRFQSYLLKFIISSVVPLQTVVSPSFIALVKALNSNENYLKALDSESLALRIKQLSENSREYVNNELRAAEHVFCTANVWAGLDRRYLAITAHWIGSDMKSKSAGIKFQKVSRYFDSERIVYMLNEVQDEFGIRGAETATIVGEYSCNFLKAFNRLGIENNSADGHDEDDDVPTCLDQIEWVYIDNQLLRSDPFNQLKCSAQILITCASVDTAKIISSSTQLSKMHERVINKCNIIWNHVQDEEVASRITDLTLTRPNAKNWTTIYNSLNEILTNKDKCCEIFQYIDTKSLEEAEFHYIEEFLTCTKPLADALKIFQDPTYFAFGALLPTLLALRRKLDKLLSREWVYCRPIAEENVRIINEQFKDFYNFTTPQSMNAAIASFSHPEFKNHWLLCVESEYHARLLQAFNEAVKAQLIPAKAEVRKVNESHEFFDFGMDDNVTESTQSMTSIVLQVSNFFSHSSKGFDCLDNFAEIKQVFLKYNTPLSSFACLGPMFGDYALNEVLSSDRLDKRTVEMRMLLKANMDMLDLD